MGAGRGWTPEEKEQLRELSGKYTDERIARIMERSKYSIHVMKQRLGCGSFIHNTDLLSRHEVARILGADWHTVRRWEELGLKSRRKGKKFNMYSQDALVKFLYEHQDLWNAKRVTDDSIFAGAEWYRIKRESDAVPKFRWSIWETAQLKKLYYQDGHTLTEIAQIMGRSKASVVHKLYNELDKERKGK